MSNINSLYFYVIIFSLLTLLMMLFDYNYKKKNIKFSYFILIIVFCLLTFISGFRYKVGTDYSNYIGFYGGFGFLEIGSQFLFKIANFISSNPQTIIFIYSFLTNLFLILAIVNLRKKNETFLIFATYLFMYLPFSYNIIRQGLSMAICLYAFSLLQENKRYKVLFLLLIAFSIHYSSIVLFPYFLTAMFSKNKKNNYKRILLLTLFVLVLMLFASTILIRFKFFYNYRGYFLSVLINKIDFNFLLAYLPFIIVLMLFKKSIKNSIILQNYSSIFISGFLFEFLLSSSNISRIALYFSIIQIILFPNLLNQIKDKFSRKIIKIIYYIFLILYFIYVFYVYGRTEIFPYNNVYF